MESSLLHPLLHGTVKPKNRWTSESRNWCHVGHPYSHGFPTINSWSVVVRYRRISNGLSEACLQGRLMQPILFDVHFMRFVSRTWPIPYSWGFTIPSHSLRRGHWTTAGVWLQRLWPYFLFYSLCFSSLRSLLVQCCVFAFLHFFLSSALLLASLSSGFPLRERNALHLRFQVTDTLSSFTSWKSRRQKKCRKAKTSWSLIHFSIPDERSAPVCMVVEIIIKHSVLSYLMILIPY